MPSHFTHMIVILLTKIKIYLTSIGVLIALTKQAMHFCSLCDEYFYGTKADCLITSSIKKLLCLFQFPTNEMQ